MATRSLQASAKGIERANLALGRYALNQNALAEDLGLSRQTVNKFFKGKPIDRENFGLICDRLGLDLEDTVVTSSNRPEDNTHVGTEQLDTLVQLVREQIHASIQEQCGKMRVLDMTQPIGLNAIYTTVNIFETVSGRQRRAIADLLEQCNVEDLISLGRVKEERVPGLKAVEQHPKLMILGKPGAGKTTFLKWIAIQCNDGHLWPKQAPTFITLKDFAEAKGEPDLLNYICKQWIDCNVQDDQATETLLRQGRVVILLDGLDEVRDTDHNRVLREIREFSTRFHTCQYVMTCRIAAREYTFEQFTEVEVADFDDQQITDFVTKWFEEKKDSIKAERFLQKLKDNQRIRELATNPLLLTLLCLVFQESAGFPPNRSELYREGLDVLLRKWDAKRNIERNALHKRGEIYQSLSLQRKEALLSHIAFTTFNSNDIFFKQQIVEQYIADFIRNLPNISDDPTSLELDSEAVLKSIEAQHGLLVERARGIYSFSHLTFQEYFTAKKIANSPAVEAVEALQDLVHHVTEKRWREVFLLTVGMQQNADDLLLRMKAEIDALVAEDEGVQQFLTWAHEKAGSVESSYKLGAIRAYYSYSALALDRALYRASARALDLDSARAFDSALDSALYSALYRASARAFDLASARTLDSTLDSALDSALYLASASASASASTRALDHARALDSALEIDSVNTKDSKLKESLQTLKQQLPVPDGDLQVFHQGWKEHGREWVKQLRSAIIQYRNSGRDWQLNQAQAELLEQYFTANKLLVDCLNSDCYVTRPVREEIEATLLLPKSLLNKERS